MFYPIDKEFSTKDVEAIWCKGPKTVWNPMKYIKWYNVVVIYNANLTFLYYLFTFSKSILLHCLNDNDKQQRKQVKSFPNIWAGNLKKIVFVEFFENAAFYLNKLKNIKAWCIKPIITRRVNSTFHLMSLLRNQYFLLTLFDIMIVSNALFEAFIATFKVVACSNTNKVCNITYPIVSKKWGKTPMCSRFRPFGSVAVQKSASIVSCPKAENKRSPTCEW